jgi:hypothetical protein
MTDRARNRCRDACTDPGGCGCDVLETFDIGTFMLNMMGRYLRSGGTFFSDDLCQSSNDCDDLVPPPPIR